MIAGKGKNHSFQEIKEVETMVSNNKHMKYIYSCTYRVGSHIAHIAHIVSDHISDHISRRIVHIYETMVSL